MKINVRVPASSANLGSGVDCFGIALNLYLTACFEESDKPEVIFGNGMPSNLSEDDNYVLKAVKTLTELAGESVPTFRLTLNTEIPLARGLGSSSAALVAGLWGANALLKDPLPEHDLIELASKLEGHPDNVVPAALGGFTMALTDDKGIFYRNFRSPDLHYLVAIPNYRLSTEKARSVLPESVPLKTAIGQLQRAALLGAALSGGKVEELARLTEDELFTPARSVLMPGTKAAREAALSAGALCSFVSGAGPTVLAMAKDKADFIAFEMKKAFEKEGISCEIIDLSADNQGVVVTLD